MKVFFRRIHLYLGLAAGLVILIACLTGAILVFEKDLQMAFNKDRYYVSHTGNKLSADSLVSKVKLAFAGAKINNVKVYGNHERSAEINITPAAKKETNATNSQPLDKKQGPPERQPGYTIFINPYTGDILDKYSYRETGFYTVFALHRWLLGGQNSIGKLIVGVSTLIFLFIILTGIILWWPKTKKILQKRLTLKWSAGWKRINHDLHIVLGFYSSILLFIFAFTGLAWSFEWFNKGIYKVTNSSMKPPPPPASTYLSNAKTISFEQALATAFEHAADAEYYNVSVPKDSVGTVNVSVLKNNSVHESATDMLYLDQYSGKLLSKMDFADRNLGARVRSTFKPVHTGSIWGMPSKIIAFIVCLLGASFPITGTIMWINRTRKKKKRAGIETVPVRDEEIMMSQA